VAQANVKLTVDASGATRALQGVQNRTNALQKSFGGLKSAIVASGIVLLGRQAVRTSANFNKLNVRLGLLTKASGTFARSQEIASDAQKAFGLSSTEALEGITDITARLQPLGVGVEDIKSTFFGFNTAAKLAGASTMEASNAFRQLAQALGSGRLQGDEFRSISEQIPTLLAPVADELNTTVGELKKFASEGKLTSDVVLRALRKIETEGAGSLKALIENDPTQVFKNLSNATEDLSRAFGEKLNPVVLPAVKALTELTKAIVNFMNTPLAQTIAILTGVALAAKAISVAVTLAATGLTMLTAKLAITGTQSIIAAVGLKGLAGSSSLAAIGIGKVTVALGLLKFATIATGFGAIALAIGGITTAVIKHNQEQKKFNDLVKEGSETSVEAAISQLEIKRLKLRNQLEETNDKRATNSIKRKLRDNEEDIRQLLARLKIIRDEKKAIDESTDSANKLKEAFKQVGDKIATGVSDALTDAILQTKSLADSARNLLQGIARDLVRLGVNTFLSSTFGGIFSDLPSFGGGKAAGGPVSANRSFLVGEKGPEMFVPSRAGTIIPNNELGGGGLTNNIVVNVDVNGGVDAQGGEEEGRELGRLIAVAVQSEIIQQKRAGGLLA
jgi:tape measure domain-containing protein